MLVALVAAPPPGTAVISPERAERRFAKACSLFQDRIEHRREVTRRGVDDPHHLGSGGLLREGLVALGSALGELASKVSNDLLRIG